MQHQLTDDEVRAEYIRVMGGDLGLLYSELEDELEWLRDKWGDYHFLFCNGPERIDMLNVVASNFFALLQKLLFEDAMMHLSRLTDPPQSAGRNTLTVMRLADQINDPSLKASVRNQAAQTKTRCEFARAWRNKRLAHTDLLNLRAGKVSNLPNVNVNDVDEAVKSIRDLLTSVGSHYSPRPFGQMAAPWGSKSLLYYLEKAGRMEGYTFGTST
jgi:hypothetical protein